MLPDATLAGATSAKTAGQVPTQVDSIQMVDELNAQEAAIRQDPDERAPSFALCAARVRARHVAVDALLRDLELRFPTAASGWDQVGKAFLDVRDQEAALVCFMRSLRVEPSPTRAVLTGTLLRGSRRFTEAREAFRAGGGMTAQAWLGLALCEQDLDRLSESADAYREAIACEPGLAIAHFNLGKVLQKLRDHNGAKAAYSSAVAIRSEILKPVAKAMSAEREGELWLDLGHLRRSLGIR
jgi:tetratricopeptide (TPR) repeat protein